MNRNRDTRGPWGTFFYKRTNLLVVLPYLAVLPSCSGVTDSLGLFGPAKSKFGTPVGPTANIISPTWSESSREILFLDYIARNLYVPSAVDVASGTLRQLTTPIDAGGNGGRAAASADGASLYFTLEVIGETRYTLYRLPLAGGSPTLVRADLYWPWFATSADDASVAYVQRSNALMAGREALIVAELKGAARLEVRPGWHPPRAPFAFSPAGDHLIYRSEGADGGLRLFSLRDRTVTPLLDLAASATTTSIVSGVLWRNGSPELTLVERTGEQMKLVRVIPSAGTRTVVADVPSAEGLPWTTAWSRDGRKVALWLPIQTGPQSCEGGICINRRDVHWRLWIWTAGRGWSVAAEMVANEGARWLEFSPDGAYIGYQLFTATYFVKLP